MIKGDESKSSSKSIPSKGVEALYVPVMTPNNAEAALQFQWMRLHPLTLIAMSEAVAVDQDSPSASEAALHTAKLFPQHRKAAVVRSKPSFATSDANKSNCAAMQYSPFLQASGVGVDLADLIEPPLISTSVPTFSYDKEESVKKPNLVDAIAIQAADGVEVHEPLHNLAKSAFAEIESNYVMETSELRIESLASLTTLELRTKLSSLVLREFLQKKYAERVQVGLVAGTAAEFFLLCLALLAKFGANQEIGRHLLKVIAPPMLVDCNDLVTNPNLSNVGARLFRRLARALLVDCLLGSLSKRELLSLMPALDRTNNCDSDALRELFCCLGEAYTAAKK